MRLGRLALVAAAVLLGAAATTVLAVAVNFATDGSVTWPTTIEHHALRWMAGATAAVAVFALLAWWGQRWYEAGRGEPVPAAQRPASWAMVSAWSAKHLNVHPAVPGQRVGAPEGFVLPEYVARPHDVSIRNCLGRLATGSETRLLLLLGGSCTGKSRAAYEAVQAVLPSWRLAYPRTAEALQVLLDGPPVAAKSVVWLDDLHQLLSGEAGEQAAVMLRELLQQPGPVALIATAWPDACKELTGTPGSGQTDRHYQARTLLSEAWTTDIPDTFVGADYREFERLAAGDASLAAVRAAGSAGEVTQILAAAPELMEHWLRAQDPYGKAVITAAVDARRLGIRSTLPDAFLEAAASGYCTPQERAQAQPAWFDEAMDYARQPIKRVTRALYQVPRPTGMGALPRVSDLADYLEQHGATQRWDQVPPTEFWTAALDHICGGDDLERLALNAFSRGRFRLSRDLNLSALRQGTAEAFEGLCFSYIETDRILTQEGRSELASEVRNAKDGGYSLWYLGSTLWSIHSEPGGGGNETLRLAAQLLSDSYKSGFLDADFLLAQVCAAIGVGVPRLVVNARGKGETQRVASSLQGTARDLQNRYMTAADLDRSATPSALQSLLMQRSVDDHAVIESVLRWWQERPEETRDLLDFCCRSNRVGAVIGAARSLHKQFEPAARHMAEDFLGRLADDGYSGAQMELARWRIDEWQQNDPAADEACPQDIHLLLVRAAENRTEARRLLGQDAMRRGDVAEAEHRFRGALDGGDYTVLPKLAEILYPRSPEDARLLALSGLNADGSPCPSW